MGASVRAWRGPGHDRAPTVGVSTALQGATGKHSLVRATPAACGVARALREFGPALRRGPGLGFLRQRTLVRWWVGPGRVLGLPGAHCANRRLVGGPALTACQLAAVSPGAKGRPTTLGWCSGEGSPSGPGACREVARANLNSALLQTGALEAVTGSGFQGASALGGRLESAGTRGAGPHAAERSVRRSSMALNATTTVETLMSTAPTAGERRKPMPASTPAARGMATAL